MGVVRRAAALRGGWWIVLLFVFTALLVIRELGGDGTERLPAGQRETGRLALQQGWPSCHSLADVATFRKLYVDSVVRDASCHSIEPALDNYRVLLREDTLFGVTLDTVRVCGDIVC
jgi:hypothetical protein